MSLPRKSQKPMKRTRIKRSNPKRRAKEFKRCYGSKERVAFVKSLPCAACGVVGFSENAHVHTGGIGRKSEYTNIVPLCGNNGYGADEAVGHHVMYDRYRWLFKMRFPDFDAEAIARDVEARWQEFQKRGA